MIGGCAVWLDGVNDYVDLGVVAARNFTNTTFSGMAWVHPASLAALSSVLYHGVSGASGYSLNVRPSGALRFQTNSPGIVVTDSAVSAVVLNSWQHIAFVLNGSNCLLYRNGDLIDIALVGAHAAPIGSAGNSAVGATVGGLGSWFSGAIDEAAFFNVALTQEQIRDYMHASLGASTANCVSLHHFDDGRANFAGTSAAATISGVAGTLTNGATWVYDMWAPSVEPRVSSTGNVAIAVATEVAITGTLRRWIPRVKTRIALQAQWDILATTAGTGSLRCLIRENGVALAHEATMALPAAPLIRGSHTHVATRDWNASTVYTLEMAARLNAGVDTLRATLNFPHTGYVVETAPVDGTY